MITICNLFKHLSIAHKRRVKILVWTGFVISCVSAFMSLTFPVLLSASLKSQMKIKLGNEITTNWLVVPVVITVKIHIWNLKNPNEFLKGDKPVLNEIGPYYWK